MSVAFKCDSCGDYFDGQAVSTYETELQEWIITTSIKRKVREDETLKKQKAKPKTDMFYSVSVLWYTDSEPTSTPKAELCSRCVKDIAHSALMLVS